MIGRRLFLALAALSVLAVPAPAQEAPRLLILGDSLAAGDGLAPDDQLVPVLSRWLDRHGIQARIDNASLPGDTTAGGLARLGPELLDQADAVMVELGGNDILLEIPPAKAEANLDAILTRAGADGRPVLLAGIMARPTDPPAKQRAWAQLWPRLAERHDALLLENLYAPLIVLPPERQPEMIQPDGIHPTAKAVNLIVEDLGPKVAQLLSRITP